MVREQAGGANRTTFFSSHLIDEVEAAADRVGIIDAGRAIYEGGLSALSDSVKMLVAPAGDPLPEGLQHPAMEILQDRVRGGRREIIVRARSSSLRELLKLPRGWRLVEMNLEDIFVAMVARPLKTETHAGPSISAH